jgi:Glutamine amidotransferase class-I
MRILVVDNYDSFVFNLVQYLGQLGVEADVWRNDDARLSDQTAVAAQFDGVLLSPGPGTPERAGASIGLVRACAERRTPLLGVCLGHQAIGVAFGATVDRAPELLHGKTSSAVHGDPVPLADDPARVAARGAGGDGPHPQRCDHGRAPHRAADPRCPVPSRVDPHRGRAPHAGELACVLRLDARRHVGPPTGERGPRRGPAAFPGVGDRRGGYWPNFSVMMPSRLQPAPAGGFW